MSSKKQIVSEPPPLNEQATLRTTLFRKSAHSAELRFFHRLHCVLLISSGFDGDKVATAFGENNQTINRWVKNFKEHGQDGLKELTKPGRPCSYTHIQLKNLQQDLQHSPHLFGHQENHWSGTLIEQHLRCKYHIKLSCRQCQRLLKKLQDKATIGKHSVNRP